MTRTHRSVQPVKHFGVSSDRYALFCHPVKDLAKKRMKMLRKTCENVSKTCEESHQLLHCQTSGHVPCLTVASVLRCEGKPTCMVVSTQATWHVLVAWHHCLQCTAENVQVHFSHCSRTLYTLLCQECGNQADKCKHIRTPRCDKCKTSRSASVLAFVGMEASLLDPAECTGSDCSSC